jgi:hypothetical protein
MGTTEERALRLDSMPHDLAAAVLADRSEFVNGALEAVEGVGVTGSHHLKGQVVIVAANFTSSHRDLLKLSSPTLLIPNTVPKHSELPA